MTIKRIEHTLFLTDIETNNEYEIAIEYDFYNDPSCGADADSNRGISVDFAENEEIVAIYKDSIDVTESVLADDRLHKLINLKIEEFMEDEAYEFGNEYIDEDDDEDVDEDEEDDELDYLDDDNEDEDLEK